MFFLILSDADADREGQQDINFTAYSLTDRLRASVS